MKNVSLLLEETAMLLNPNQVLGEIEFENFVVRSYMVHRYLLFRQKQIKQHISETTYLINRELQSLKND